MKQFGPDHALHTIIALDVLANLLLSNIRAHYPVLAAEIADDLQHASIPGSIAGVRGIFDEWRQTLLEKPNDEGAH